jgi:ATP-dependent DNA helicase RecQ
VARAHLFGFSFDTNRIVTSKGAVIINLQAYLKEYFGYDEFKLGQEEVIEQLLQGRDTFAVLPTGTGKSLCYQMTGQLINGSVLIVSPLLSLMEDQVRQLQTKGIFNVIAVNSSLDFQEKQYVLNHLSAYKFLFFSPEMLVQEAVISRLSRLEIGLLVIDEAHCVYQWGIDFRPEYEKLGQVRSALGQPLTLALTATATPAVRKEIKQQLFSKSTAFHEVAYSVNRQNIGLLVNQTSDKAAALMNYVTQFSHNIIVYCATRKTTEEVAAYLGQRTSLKTAFYHGGLSTNERSLLQQQFIANHLDVLCATNAFGMGIDKSDVRVVIHYDLPDSLENYVQEIGRAGRDGKPSLAILLYKQGDEAIHHFFQETTKADRKMLQQLTDIDPAALEQTLASATEIQQKWLQGYLQREYSLEELAARLMNREKERQAQLSSMLSYINEAGCRRQFIQQYFSEPLQGQSPTTCCDRCQLTFDKIQAEIVESTEIPQKEDWRSIILKLFKDQK